MVSSFVINVYLSMWIFHIHKAKPIENKFKKKDWQLNTCIMMI